MIQSRHMFFIYLIMYFLLTSSINSIICILPMRFVNNEIQFETKFSDQIGISIVLPLGIHLRLSEQFVGFVCMMERPLTQHINDGFIVVSIMC